MPDPRGGGLVLPVGGVSSGGGTPMESKCAQITPARLRCASAVLPTPDAPVTTTIREAMADDIPPWAFWRGEDRAAGSRVASSRCRPEAPTDPDVQYSRIRLLGKQVRYVVRGAFERG